MIYKEPNITIKEIGTEFLAMSGPCAGDIGSPSVRNNSKSIWDEESDNTLFNIKEEQSYEDKVYE